MEIRDYIILGEWKHIKSGEIYTVTGMRVNTTNSSDGHLMVEYQGKGLKFVRELKEFKKKFEKVEGK